MQGKSLFDEMAMDLAKRASEGRLDAAEISEQWIGLLLAEKDLESFGTARPSAHGESLTGSWWLCYHPSFSVLMTHVPFGRTVPVHDHDASETIAIYRGKAKYRLYERIDDQSVPLQSSLRVVEDRIMGTGDISVMPPPPNDIHGFTALTDDVYAVGVVLGPLAKIRKYHNVEQGYYLEAEEGFPLAKQ